MSSFRPLLSRRSKMNSFRIYTCLLPLIIVFEAFKNVTMKILNYFSMSWKVFTTMSASIHCQFYKIGSIISLFPNFMWTLLPTQESQSKERNQGTGGDVSHLECQNRITALSSDPCDQFYFFPSLPSVIKLSTFSWCEGTTHSDHCFPLDLFFLPLLLSPFRSRIHNIDLYST